MIKKVVIYISLCCCSFQTNAQFFRGFGVYAGGTTTSHRYVNTAPIDPYFFTHTIAAPSHRTGELIYFSGGLFAEFLKYDYIRWQTELEYCKKGAIERPLLYPWPAIRGNATVNSYTNIQWNNSLKILFNEGYRGTPYVMIGARLEYNLIKQINAYAAVANLVPKLTITPDVALGYEFVSFSKWHLFSELHYNPDLLKIKTGTVLFWQRMIELRIGLIYRPKKSIDDCNAPRYHGTDY